MGWRVLPSRANFIFAELPGREGREIYRILKDKGILVRHFMQEGIQNFLRISMGTNEEMEEFLEKIRDLGLTAESHTGGNTSTQTEEKND
jgi:histidinol-phosphate aminotransferase